jgi:uncharacterized membrane protein
MSDRALRHLAAALALVGAGLMAYLLYVRHTGGAPICTGDGCATVQRSHYAEIFGLPVAALGLVGFLTVFLTSLLPGPRAKLVQAVVVLSALGFGAYLLLVQVFVIGDVCDWCLAGDVMTTGLAAVVLVRLRSLSV